MRNLLRLVRPPGGGGRGGFLFGRCIQITIVLSILSTLFFWLTSPGTSTTINTSSSSAVWKDHHQASSSSSSSPNGTVRTESRSSSTTSEETTKEEMHDENYMTTTEFDEEELEITGGGAIRPSSAAWWDYDDENSDDGDDKQALLLDHEKNAPDYHDTTSIRWDDEEDYEQENNSIMDAWESNDDHNNNNDEGNKEEGWADDFVYRQEADEPIWNDDHQDNDVDGFFEEDDFLLEPSQDANNDKEEQVGVVQDDDVDKIMTWNQILEKHALCFNEILQQDNSDGSRTFNCSSTNLDFAPIHDDSTVTSSYDHLSNFVMKARYNCAPRTRKAWKLLLYPNFTTTTRRNNENWATTAAACDLEQLIQDVGGPAGVGRRQLLAAPQQRRMDELDTTVVNIDEDETTNINDDDDAAAQHVYTVVFLGDSRLRQIWESLVGRYSDDITALKLLLHGQPHTAETEHHVYTQYDDLGEILYYTRENLTDIQEQGCHGTDFMHLFYPPGSDTIHSDITMPPNLNGCSDDMSMVEFQHSVRFYFVQRPWSFETLNLAWDKLGLFHPDEQIDAYVTNVRHRPYPYTIHNDNLAAAAAVFGYEEQEQAPPPPPPPPRVEYYPPNPPNEHVDASSPFTKFFWDVPTLYEASIRDLGFWDGATNAGIHDPPDAIHPCMPGLPDDQANLLLFLLLANATHFSCGNSSESVSGGSDYGDDEEDISTDAD